MLASLLGKTIDIHMGGIEHIPIHHTNEIAQSESANEVKFVNYWLHNEHLVVDDRKMAKSEGTGLILNDVLEKGYSPMDLRYFFLNAHYRSKQNFTWEALSSAKEGYDKLKNFVLSLKSPTTRKTLSSDKLDHLDQYRQKFIEYISNDFQIPQALAISWEMLKSNIPSPDKLDLLFEFDQVFGLKLNELETIVIPEEIMKLAKEREEARKRGDFKSSDSIRKQISEKGFLIEDLPQGFKIRPVVVQS